MEITKDNFKAKLTEMYNKVFGVEEQKFIDLKLQDGTTVRVAGEKILVNAQISAIDEAGTLIPLATGNYVAEDGSMINVTDGVITAYEPKAGDDAGVVDPLKKPDEQMSDNVTPITQPQAKALIESTIKETRFEIEKATDEKFTKVNEAIAEATKVSEAFKKENETLKVELQKQVDFTKQMFELVQKIADQPAEKEAFEKKEGLKKEKFIQPLVGIGVWETKK